MNLIKPHNYFQKCDKILIKLYNTWKSFIVIDVLISLTYSGQNYIIIFTYFTFLIIDSTKYLGVTTLTQYYSYNHVLTWNINTSIQNTQNIDEPWYVRNTTIHKDMKTPFASKVLHITYSRQHLYLTQTLMYVTFHNTCHPKDNTDVSRDNATRTSSYNTRRETVTGLTPPINVTHDKIFFFSKLYCICL